MENENSLTCSITIEWLNAQGTTTRKLSNKTSTARLIRSDARKIFIEITAPKAAPIKLELKAISVHKKFMNEGKSSIKFQEINCTVYLSNAPPAQLLTFLRTMFVKMTGERDESAKQPTKPLRTQMLAKPNQFEEISPVTMTEINRATKISKASDTTPSPLSKKRRLSDREGVKAAKRLYSASPLPLELDMEQKSVIDACLGGTNVFFTGSAGTGKSHLLKRIIGSLPPDATFATASTGVAACHIGGTTLHQFAGIGAGEASLARSVQLASRPGPLSAWRRCRHLVIDEISMVDGAYFDKIEAVARQVRNNDKPFGGIQLILCGDFFQLPPVRRNRADLRFCFEVEAWQRCRLHCMELKRVHRQHDEEFIAILNSVRSGRVLDYMAARLAGTAKQVIEKNGILATRLCSHTDDANVINESKLAALGGEKVVLAAEDSDPNLGKQMDQLTPALGKLELKVGAQVMLLKNVNISTGLVNGARGVVKAFQAGLPLVQFRNVEYLVKKERWNVKTSSGMVLLRRQVPLKLAWAFSIHKSQGLTLDCVEMSLGKVFEAGQAYVALSRAQSLDTLRILDFKATQVWANDKVLEFYRNLRINMDVMRFIPLGAPKEGKRGAIKSNKSGLTAKMLRQPLVSIK